MTIPMGKITRSYLRFFRLSPTQCARNMFRVLGSIEVLNERMDLNLTHWVYNLNHLKGQEYYLKSRYPAVRLIQCLPTSNKNLKENFLIFSGEWHDGLPCPMEEGEPSGNAVIDSITFGLYIHVFPFLSFFFLFFVLFWVLVFLSLMTLHFNSMILQIDVLPSPNLV